MHSLAPVLKRTGRSERLRVKACRRKHKDGSVLLRSFSSDCTPVDPRAEARRTDPERENEPPVAPTEAIGLGASDHQGSDSSMPRAAHIKLR